MRTIKQLQVRHIRGARRVDILHPDQAVVEIAGDNGAGKSSALDAVQWGIVGKRALPVQPLHRGASRGSVRLDLGDLTVTRTITESNQARGGTVRIEAADGSKWGQRDLQALYGAWTFDPLAFARAKPEAQVAQVRRLAGPEFCSRLERLEGELAAAREERTDAGRDERSHGRPQVPEPVEPVDTAELLERIRAAHEANGQAAAKRRAIADAEANLLVAVGVHDRAVRDLEIARRRVETARTAPGGEPQDLAPLEAELAEATERNARHAAYAREVEKFEAWQQAARKHAAASERVDELQEERSQHLRTAALPIEGLSWEGDQIALGGVPFAGLSTTEQLLLSARIGMAMSPDLRVMLVREGGLIDDSRFAALRELAEREGYQIWVETAGRGHGSALVIQDGELSDEAPDEWTE